MSQRVARKRGERVRAILTTAAELLGERGYEDVSLEDVAERLDVTKGSLYYYFASKDELVTAAIETLGTDWTDRLEALPVAGPPAERLRALLREHIRIAVREYPAALRLFLVPDDWPAEQQARIKALRRRHDGVFRAVVEEGLRSGEFAVVAVGPTLQAMHAAMSQAPVWVRGEEQIDQLADTLMRLVRA
ncbi:TetR/AcrR family transcriptional regulator [Pseudonocardia xishanensis]|uniref:TetR/AcrR family transcriptional regulator n=1 Tax=Pseudonocardia xishanensis TaxID=630995 RepID=A0ABP8RDM2_9PSEU